MGAIKLEHNLEPEKFMWLWMKYVSAVNDQKHCTNSLRGRYSKILSKHNPLLDTTPELHLNERPTEEFSYIYICGVIKKGYPRSNYPHNLHAVVKPAPGFSDSFEFENWRLAVTNGTFESIPTEAELPSQYRGLPPAFTACRIFRWAVCSRLNSNAK
jgi:hypothetical protein